MKYFTKFNSRSERVASLVEHVHFEIVDDIITPPIPAGFIEITEADQELYATNEYIRGANGKPEKRAAHIPSLEDVVNQIAARYESLIADLKDALVVATLAADDEAIVELKVEYAALLVAYREELEGVANDF